MTDIDLESQARRAMTILRNSLSIEWFRPPPPAQPHLAILSGSFNPPTTAHATLLRAAASHTGGWPVYLVPVKAVDKEAVTIMRVEDRLALLAAGGPEAIAVTSVGLYVDQARAFRAIYPGATFTFVVGYDKLVQILDPRYYADRDAALDALFGLARLLVAPRGDDDSAAVQRTIDTDGGRWRRAIAVLPQPANLDSRLSSTAVRAISPHDLRDEVNTTVRDFLIRWQPFHSPELYHERWRRLDATAG